MKPSNQLKIGLAGLGRFGILHAKVLSSMANVELLAIAETRPEPLKEIGELYGVERRYKEAEELIKDPDLDAIVIVTPNDQHEQHCLQALATGKPVFIEKPLASNYKNAQNLKQAAENSGSILQVGLILRYELNHRIIHQQIHQKSLGELISIRTKRNLSRSWFTATAERVHTVYESSIHDLDLLLWLTGSKPISVFAHERRLGNHLSPEACIALIKFENGCIGITETSWFVPTGAPANVTTNNWKGCIDAELVVVGSNKTVQLRSLDSPLKIWDSSGTISPDSALWPEYNGRIYGALREELDDFVKCASQGVESATANLEDAVNGLHLADAIIESARTGTPIIMNQPNG
ncbi:MAG: gfo/Idh/MocA family oxidoreductase [Synechococcaceae bacterium WBA_3_309]|nr:gfo/Idh/MocA family oxidoreductase [Synechococcaceae bacterium WBA_3_309]